MYLLTCFEKKYCGIKISKSKWGLIKFKYFRESDEPLGTLIAYAATSFPGSFSLFYYYSV